MTTSCGPRFGKTLILAGIMSFSLLTGCDYWPPALLAQLEQLRIHLQDLADERAELETQLREAALDQEEMRAGLENLQHENRQLRHQLAGAERTRTARQTRPIVRGPKTALHTRGQPSTLQRTARRVMSVTRPLMRGEDVKTVQRHLKQQGFRITVDGQYGPGTKNIVKRFQHKQDLTADGIVGPGTFAALTRSTARTTSSKVFGFQKPFMTGPQVKNIQRALRHAGVLIRIDGAFGSQTKEAVAHFQRTQGLLADGVVGPMTRKALGLS